MSGCCDSVQRGQSDLQRMEVLMHNLKALRCVVLASAVLVLSSGIASAQTSGNGTAGAVIQPAPIAPAPKAAPVPSGSSQKAPAGLATAPSSDVTPVVGVPVLSRDNAKVGKVENVIVAPDGKVDKLIVAVGGVLGIGAKEVAVNWDQMKMETMQREARLDLSKTELDSAPAYNEPASAATKPVMPPAAPVGGVTPRPASPQQQQ
jgi:hypothetical protein